jgi:Cys-tRNA(Pro)/Cys-tRNA(Cys) deacylase
MPDNKPVPKLNSMRFLETQNVPYEALPYDESAEDAVAVAEILGVLPAHVFKTLVIERVGGGANSKPILFMLPADKHVDLKKLAAAVGEKKVSMAAHADAEALTGLKVGGIGALALTHKNWAVYIDASATRLQHICVSAGQRGINLRVPVADLIRILKARVVEATAD